MLPVSMLMGFALGLVVRWWSVLVGAIWWALVVALFGDTSAWPGAFALGGLNALVGTMFAIGVRRITGVRSAIDAR
jgi:hypothetical protein